MYATQGWDRKTKYIIGLEEQLKIVDKVKNTSLNVLLVGETGTGKELLANALHFNSCRSQGQYRSFNCSMMEGETALGQLYGHVKGAYTGSVGQQGFFAVCKEGTLVLNEIDKLSAENQPMLLNAIGDGYYTRLGSTRMVPVKARMVFATQDISNLRDDFYHRMQIKIEIPPLRKRKHEIAELASFYYQKYGDELGLADMPDIDALMKYDWPGNVRELQNVIRDYMYNGRLEIDIDREFDTNFRGTPLKDPLHMMLSKNGERMPTEQDIQDYVTLLRSAITWSYPTKRKACEELGFSPHEPNYIDDDVKGSAFFEEYKKKFIS